MDFAEFPKMPRLTRECLITEKLDGTNAQIAIVELEGYPIPGAIFQKDGLAMFTGSRTRWITPADDNYGFSRWCLEHAEELLTLGPGRHFGEWWGQGIQRNYGLKEKRFSLFNVNRWSKEDHPACCHLVPLLGAGMFDTAYIQTVLDKLRTNGSAAVPGFMKPEGIVVFHIAAQRGFKKTIDHDDVPKGKIPD